MENKRIIVVFIGRRLTRSKKVAYTYEKEADGEVMAFSKPVRPASIGARIELTELDGQVGGPYDFKGHTSDDRIGLWTAKDASAYAKYKSYKDIKKVQTNSYTESVSTLRSYYKDLHHNQRMQFIANLVYKITS